MAPRTLAVLSLLALAAPPSLADPAALDSLMERGHWKQARAAVEARAGAGSNDAAALYVMSRVKLVSGDPAAALPLAERAVALDGGNAQYHYQLAEVLGSMAQHAGPLKLIGLARRCRKEAETAVRLDSRHVGARLDLIEYYANAPGIIGGDKKKARALADTVSQIDPAQGYLARIGLALDDKQEDQADTLYQKALAACPRSFDVLIGAAAFYGRDTRKRWDLAEKCGRAAIEIDPERGAGYARLASLYAHLGRLDDLDAILARGARTMPEDLGAFYQAGRVLLADGKELPRAERCFRSYLTQEPEPGEPTLAHAHWRLALVLEKLGRPEEAVAELDTALKLKPDLDAAKKDLKRIKRR